MLSPGEQQAGPGQAAAWITEKKWGAGVRLLPSVTIAVGTSETQLVKNNPRRLELLVVNVDISNVTVDWTFPVVFGTGIILTPSGGFLIISVDEDGELVTYELHGIVTSPAVTRNVQVWEIIRK